MCVCQSANAYFDGGMHAIDQFDKFVKEHTKLDGFIANDALLSDFDITLTTATVTTTTTTAQFIDLHKLHMLRMN